MKKHIKLLYTGILLLGVMCATIVSVRSQITPYKGKSAAQLSAMVDYQTIANTAYWNSHAYLQIKAIIDFLGSATVDSFGGTGGTAAQLEYCSLSDTGGSVTWQSIIDSCDAVYVPPDTTTFPEDCINVLNNAHIQGHSNFTLFGNGVSSVLHATKPDSATHRVTAMLRFDSDSNIVIYGVNFMADKEDLHAQSEFDHCITLNNCKNVWIINCKFDCSGDGVNIQSTVAGGGHTSNIFVIGNYFKGDSLRNADWIWTDPPGDDPPGRYYYWGTYKTRAGVPIIGNADNVVIANNVFDGFRVAQVTCMSYSGVATRWEQNNIVINGNTFMNFYGHGAGAATVSVFPEAKNNRNSGVSITGNTFLNNKSAGVALAATAAYPWSVVENVTITGNSFYNTPSEVLGYNSTINLYQRVKNVVISGNTIRKSMNGIVLSSISAAGGYRDSCMTGITIANNLIDSVESFGIFVCGTYPDTIKGVTITGNIITNYGQSGDRFDSPGTTGGISAKFTTGLVVNSNQLYNRVWDDSSSFGIKFSYCRQTTFVGNSIHGDYRYHIRSKTPPAIATAADSITTSPCSWGSMTDFQYGHNTPGSTNTVGDNLPVAYHEDLFGSLGSGHIDFFKIWTFTDAKNPSDSSGVMILSDFTTPDTAHIFDPQGSWYHHPYNTADRPNAREGQFLVDTTGDSLLGYLSGKWQSIFPVQYDSTDMYQIINVHAHGIEDDSTDQTVALENLVAAYPSGTEFYFPYVHGGKYYFAGRVDLAASTGKAITFRFDPATTVYADTNWLFVGSSSLVKFNKLLDDTCGINTEKLYMAAGEGALYEGYEMGIIISGTAWYNSATYKKGEMVLFRDIDTDTIWADGALHDNYTSPAENNYLHAIDACTFKCYDLTLEYTTTPYNFTVGIKVVYGLGCQFVRCHIKNAGNAAIQLPGCYNTTIEGCSFEGCNADGYGYAIELDESYYTNVLNCYSWNNREFVATGANNNYPPTRHVYCSGNYIRGGGKVYSVHGVLLGDMWTTTSGGQKGFDSHEPTEYYHMTGNTIVGTTYACAMRGNFNTFSDNIISGKTNIMYLQSYGGSATIVGNTYEPGLQSRIKILTEDGTTEDQRTRQLDYGIVLEAGCKSDSLVSYVINDNKLNGVEVAFLTAKTTAVRNIICKNNFVRFSQYKTGVTTANFLYNAGIANNWYNCDITGNTVQLMSDVTYLWKYANITLNNSTKVSYLQTNASSGASQFFVWPPDTVQTPAGHAYKSIYLANGDTLYFRVFPPDSL